MPAPGTCLGPYEIQAPIGAGGMGEVYRARDPRIGRDVAIKVLPPGFAKDAERLRRFEQEARTTGSLSHPNILTVYDVGTHDGAPYLVMELLEGETLRARLVGRPLPVKRAVDIAQAVARGLAAAHEKGIVHRDLKPENVFITRDGRTKILDFGLAKSQVLPSGAESLTQALGSAPQTGPGMVLGTVGYMSPEQVRAEKLDGRSDLFALGTLLWEMLTGQRPFSGATPLEVLTAILNAEPPPLDGSLKVPPSMERILRSCLAKEPSGRFHSAHDLAFALEGITTTTPSGGIQGIPSPRWARWRRGWPALAGTLAVLAWLGAARLLQWAPFRPSPQPTFTRLTFRKGNLHGAGFAPDGRTIIYAADWDGRPTDIFQVRTDSLESRPLGLPPGTGLLAVSSRGELAIILREKGILARVPIQGGTPRQVLEGVENSDAAWSPDGRELAVFRRTEGKARLEYPIGTTLYETSNTVRLLRMSPSGRRLLFAESLPEKASPVIRVVGTDRSVQTLEVSAAYIQGLAWTPDETHILASWGANASDAQVWKVSLGGGKRPVLHGPSGISIRAVSPDGRWLVEHMATRMEAFLVDGRGGAPRDISWLDRSMVRSCSADGRWTLFHDPGGAGRPRTTWLRTAEDRNPVPLCEGAPLGAPSPDGQWVPVLSNDVPRRLLLVPTGPGEAREVRVEGLTLQEALWHPDGRLLFRARPPGRQQSSLYGVSVAGGAPSLLREACPPLSAISPDGAWLAAPSGTRSPDAGQDVILLPVQGGTPRTLSQALEPKERIVQWSEDGRQLFVVSMWGEKMGRIEALDLATGRRSPLRQLPVPSVEVPSLSSVAITRDGRTVAYSFTRMLVSDLYVIEGAN